MVYIGIALREYLEKGDDRMANTNERDGDIVFEITEHIGVIKSFPSGWTKELNVVKWNDADPKFDIRDWDMEHRLMKRGVTLRQDEMETLMDLMNKRGSDLATGGQVPDGQAPGGQVS